MMDKERIKNEIIDLEKYMQRLSDMLPQSRERYIRSDTIVKNAVERNLQLISDKEFDLLALLHKGLAEGLPGNEISMLDQLKEHLGEGVIKPVRDRRALRNMLIHAYSDASYDDQAYSQAQDLGDVKKLVSETKKIISKR